MLKPLIAAVQNIIQSTCMHFLYNLYKCTLAFIDKALVQMQINCLNSCYIVYVCPRNSCLFTIVTTDMYVVFIAFVLQ